MRPFDNSMRRERTLLRLASLLFVAMLVIVLDSTCAAPRRPRRPRRPLDTLDGRRVFVGATIDWASYDLNSADILVPSLRDRLGYIPKVVTNFVQLPLRPSDLADLERIVPPLAAKNTVLVLTTEPREGLDAVTDDAIDQLVEFIAGYEAAHQAQFIVRFGHEMNGDWYAWGQQPRAFVDTFRRISDKMHASTSAAMYVALLEELFQAPSLTYPHLPSPTYPHLPTLTYLPSPTAL